MGVQNIGIIGMGVMGSNLALNIADHAYTVSVYNHTPRSTENFVRDHAHANIIPYYDLQQFIASLEKPRKIMLMIVAGEPVDQMIARILPLTDAGDIIIDGGNSFFKDTQRRTQVCREKGVFFVGMGISGGETGARRGPAVMVGGESTAYEKIRHIYEAVAAKADDDKPCCAHVGPDGAGHFVKMVHNGIEYADMQLIAEAYLLLKEMGGYTHAELADIFHEWNTGELHSYLIGITADVLAETEDGGSVLSMIADRAEQKGTGRWTGIEALAEGVDVSLIIAACNARVLSQVAGRRRAQIVFPRPERGQVKAADFVEAVRKSLYTAKIVAYAQGFALYQKASQTYGWQLDYRRIAEIFRAGCIIQAKFLDTISTAYAEDAQVENLLFHPFFTGKIKEGEHSLRQVAALGLAAGIPVPAMAGALTYLDAYAGPCVGANLIQGLRDYFGAHTFRRTDKEGNFHHVWREHYKR